MTYSQNGFKSRVSSLIATYTVVRDVKIALRKGDCSVVLLHYARWYDQHIEPLTKADTGGYNPRHIDGSSVDSNHASGTAEDLRWKKHPRGKHNTFTAGQKAKIHAQLKFYEGVLRWGEDFQHATIDGMHVEIAKGASEVARIAKKCKKPIAPKPMPPRRTTVLKVDGKLGEDTIARWQQVMGTPADGEIDDKQSELVTAVQRRLKVTVDHRLVVDGDLGPKTIMCLQRYFKTKIDGFISEPESDVVKALQIRLNTGKF